MESRLDFSDARHLSSAERTLAVEHALALDEAVHLVQSARGRIGLQAEGRDRLEFRAHLGALQIRSIEETIGYQIINREIC